MVCWKVSQHPNARLEGSTLLDAIKTLKPGEHRSIRSDRGLDYRWNMWITICIRSMSARGTSPNNAAMEGFFGRLKNEFFYYKDWSGIFFNDFQNRLGEWITYCNTKREKQNLGWKSPIQYRLNLGIAIKP